MRRRGDLPSLVIKYQVSHPSITPTLSHLCVAKAQFTNAIDAPLLSLTLIPKLMPAISGDTLSLMAPSPSLPSVAVIALSPHPLKVRIDAPLRDVVVIEVAMVGGDLIDGISGSTDPIAQLLRREGSRVEDQHQKPR